MIIKVSDVMRHVRNHFVMDGRSGTFSQPGGTLTPGGGFEPGMWIAVTGSGENLMVSARLDNLGKGASGAAVQNLNIMMGAAEDAFLA